MENQETEFKRRKFTLPKRLDKVLTDLAAQHYQGNVSLCIRASIEDHRTTLGGTTQEPLAVQRLAAHLEDIASRQEQIQTSLETLTESVESKDTSCEPPHECPVEMTESMHTVYETLETANDGLRFNDITERVKLPASAVQPALGRLVDYGHVIAVGTTTTRFYLAGNTSESYPGK